MYTPNDDIRREANRDFNRYGSPGYDSGASTRGGLVGLLIVVILMGGLIGFSMLAPTAVDDPAEQSGATTPESITGGVNTEIAPAGPAE